MKNDWLTILTRNKSATILASGIAILVIIVLTLHLSLFRGALSNAQRAYRLVQRFDALDSIGEQMTSLKRQNQFLKTQLALIEQEQDGKNKLSGVMNLLNKEIESSKLIAVSIKALSEETEGDILEQPLELHLTGNYHSFGKFVNSLEQNQLPVRIFKLKISSRDMASPLLDLKVSLSFVLLRE